MFNLLNCSFQKEINHASLSESKHCVIPRGPRDASGSAKPHLAASELHRGPADSTPLACAALRLRRAPHRHMLRLILHAWNLLKTGHGCCHRKNCPCWGEHQQHPQEVNRTRSGGRQETETDRTQEAHRRSSFPPAFQAA